eukprot:scaffold10838_cov99-Isochrysis_galbana.AAC.9
MVPIPIDPFEPTAAELAGDEPPSETDMHTERQARTRLYASRISLEHSRVSCLTDILSSGEPMSLPTCTL